MPFQTTVKRQSNDRAPKWGDSLGARIRQITVCLHAPRRPEKRRSRHTQKTTIVTGQGDRNRPQVMKCDCPDGGACRPVVLAAVYRTSRSPAPVTTTGGLLSISTERQTGALGGSGAAPCAVTADCCGYGTPAEMITADQALAKAHRARPVMLGPRPAKR